MAPCESTQGATPWPSNLSLFEVARYAKETDADALALCQVTLPPHAKIGEVGAIAENMKA